MSDQTKPDGNQLERREFLKLGALSAVTLSSCAPAAQPESTPATPPVPVPPTPQDGAGQIPPVGDLVRPEALQFETWQEPWTWRPEDWVDARLELNVVANQNPGRSTSPGNSTPALFSYNGISPGPTVRMRADGVLRLKVRNLLGLNEQVTQVGPSPDPVDMPLDTNREVCKLREAEEGGNPEDPRPCNPFLYPELLLQVINPETQPGWTIKGHINGQHCAHVTNLHTHGLHVAPVTNPDGTHSDNVLLRILPRADWEARRASDDPDLHTLADYEHVGELDYEIRLARTLGDTVVPHPPGTHWYHPHPHGATHDQVGSGMAGFLIVEGDVDDAINHAMTGQASPDPEMKTGPFDYRERLVFIQRVFVNPVDLDAGRRRNNLRFPFVTPINGLMPPAVMHMRPGAVERWRILNGSVDGAGTKRVMVLDGQFVQRNNRIWRVVTEGEADQTKRRLEPVTVQELEDAKLPLQQLSFDGITLVTEADGEVRHQIRDLAKQNEGTQNPFAREPAPGERDAESKLRAFEDCFRDGDSLRRAFVRPNELYLGNANRADVFFKAPLDSAGRVFTIFAQEAHLHTDNYQSVLQTAIAGPQALARRPLFDVVVGYIHVRGDPVEGGDFDIQSLNAHLPPVPPLFQPVREEELRVPAAEAQQSGVSAGAARTRVIGYSGTGGADFPVIRAPDAFCDAHPELEHLQWGTQDGMRILLANLTRTMAINTEFDLAAHPEPEAPRKFMPDDPGRSRVLVNTAEEWVLYNNSLALWSHTDLERFPQPGAYRQHYESFPLTRAEGQRRFWNDPEFQITTKGSDHPFHIHINPMWVIRIDVPDENGTLHNVLPEPRWMDSVPIPRNGGRVVFRTRFDDFVGRWVHHCHILLHEDMGMMQVVECSDDATDANYKPRGQVASWAMDGGEVDRIYPRPSAEIMYRQNFSFEEPNEIGRHVYPGFPLDVPKLED